MNNYDIFIGKLYDILINTSIINYEDKAKDLKEKKERLEKYLDKLDRVHSKAMSKDEHIDTIKRLYYDKYVINREYIPDGYFKSLEKRYLDEGQGYHNLVNPESENDKRLREQHIDVIINEQRDSLDSWINYFLSKDSDYLPMWAKVWAFQGMLNIGNLNKEKDGYGRRSNTAVNPFVSLDSEILGKCVDLVKETFDNNKITDKEIDKLVSSGSFAKLYGKLLANKKQLKVVSDEGIWVKYNYETSEKADKKVKNGIEPEYLKLYKSLQGYNTGWCTAGGKENAKSQICGGGTYPGGDFYVYYTKDDNNQYRIPRIAIRMDKDSIGEIRGVAESQNIEASMENILIEKLKEFPDGDLYQKKIHDMKMLTKIYDDNVKRELTKEEIIFLYELNGRISGFGYRGDPRIKEIKDKRNIVDDLSFALNCDKSQIGLNEDDLYERQLVYYQGKNIDYVKYKRIRELGFNLPDYIKGSLYLRELDEDEVDDLKLPKSVSNSLYLDELRYANSLVLPEYVGGTLDLGSLVSQTDLVFPKKVEGTINLRKLKSAYGLVLPKNIEGSLLLDGLKSAKYLELPDRIGESLSLSCLVSSEDLILPKTIGYDLDLSGLISANGLVLPMNIGGSLYIDRLTSLIDFTMPKNVKDKVYYNCSEYSFDEIKAMRQKELDGEQIGYNRRGFTIGVYTITLVLIMGIISVIIGIFLLNR